MIFDKYIALIIESIERHASLILVSTKDDNKILQTEIGALNKKYTDSVETSIASQKQLYEKIVELEEKNLELERENRLLEDSVEGIQEEFVSVSEKLEEAEKQKEQIKGLTGDVKELQGKLVVADAVIAQMEENTKNSDIRTRRAYDDMSQLKHEVQSAKAVVKSLTERSTEVQAKQDRLLQLVKEYDKATVSMLNAILERRSSIEERATWEAAKEALKGWDTPKKRGKKK